MDPNDIFIKVALSDKVKLKPGALCKNKTGIIQDILVRKYEGVCSYHGYIKHGSIAISKIGAGMIKDVFLNGDVEYTVTYNALVCNPAIGSMVRVKVINKNMFGILGEVSVSHGGIAVPVLEVIVSKMTADEENVEIEDIAIGDMVNVEILKKKFELGDDKIINVGRIIKDDVDKHKHKHEHELVGGNADADADDADADADDADADDADLDDDAADADLDDDDADLDDEDAAAAAAADADDADAADADDAADAADADEEEEDEWSDEEVDDVDDAGLVSDPESI